MNKKFKIKTGDTVIIITGKDKGKTGNVTSVIKSNDRVILITTKAKKIYTDFKFNKQDTLLFGKESAGVPKNVHNLLKEKIRIPMVGKKRSLNLSTSVAIILSESLRQIKL